jgi:hypothetical protein
MTREYTTVCQDLMEIVWVFGQIAAACLFVVYAVNDQQGAKGEPGRRGPALFLPLDKQKKGSYTFFIH